MKKQDELFNSESAFAEFMGRFQRMEEYILASSAIIQEYREIKSHTQDEKRLITPQEAAKLLQVSKRTLIRYKQTGKISFVKYDSGKVMYYYDDIIEYLTKNRQHYES